MKILLYNLENNLVLKNTLSMMNIQGIYVDTKDYNKPLSYLLGLNDVTIENNQFPFNEEMMIMYDFSEAQLDSLLALLRMNQIKIALKAIVTQTNINWTSLQIHDELIKEHVYMTRQKGS